MKARTVVLSLIFVFGLNMVGCGGDDGTVTNDQAKPETKVVTPKDDKEVRPEVTKALRSANDLLSQARAALDEEEEDSQAKASRLIGYPAFRFSDIIYLEGFAKKLNEQPGPLSKNLLTRFEPATKELLKKADDGELNTDLVKALKLELNEELRNKDLYDPSLFPKNQLSIETNKALTLKNSGQSPWKLARLNRFLLEDAYKQFISAVPPSEQTVIDHLENASNSIKALPPNLQQTDYKKVSEALENTEQLLTRISAGGEEKTLVAGDVTRISDQVSAAIKTLNPEGGSGGDDDSLTWDTILEIVKYVAITGVIIIVLGGLVYLVHRARTKRAAERRTTELSFKKLFERHEKLQQEFTSFRSEHTAQFEALKEEASRLESAYQILSRKQQTATQQAREFSRASHGDRFYEPQPLPVREEPEFPASAENYLERMKGLNRSTTVIRPDFQNGILIKDAEGRGELVLVEDPYASDWQPLIVVPSVSQFQMKQDFYNYYDTYYDCEQPAAGSVWIVHPAFVEKVSGGWRLTEKGRLEVR